MMSLDLFPRVLRAAMLASAQWSNGATLLRLLSKDSLLSEILEAVDTGATYLPLVEACIHRTVVRLQAFYHERSKQLTT